MDIFFLSFFAQLVIMYAIILFSDFKDFRRSAQGFSKSGIGLSSRPETLSSQNVGAHAVPSEIRSEKVWRKAS